MPHLGVNIDHVATLRQARGNNQPDPVEAARVCQTAGAAAIVAHLREDRRHIQDRDVFDLKNNLTIKFNLEMSMDESVTKTALEAAPDCVTLVPEHRRERTTESGIDALRLEDILKPLVSRFRDRKIGVSLFVDPDLKQIDAAKRCGADAVEIHTGPYSLAGPLDMSRALEDIDRAVTRANELSLLAHVGHGLDYQNVGALARIQGITEFNIGFSIISRALYVGLERAVQEMRRLIHDA